MRKNEYCPKDMKEALVAFQWIQQYIFNQAWKDFMFCQNDRFQSLLISKASLALYAFPRVALDYCVK